jgi:hypothetical protein
MIDDPLKGSIAALEGEPSAELQRLLTTFAQRRLKAGLRVAGVVQISEPSSDCARRELALRDIVTGAEYPIVQNLGRESKACSLDAGGVAAACAAVLQAMERGVDVVVLSKFGKLEASGGGLLDCFTAAAGAGVPCVVGVAPALSAPLRDFAGEFLQRVDVSESALEDWWAERLRVARAVIY